MRNFTGHSQDGFPRRALPVVTAALLSAGLTGICMLFLLKAYSATLVHDMTALVHNSVAETRHQDECEFGVSNRDCAPPLVFDELPDPNEPNSI